MRNQDSQGSGRSVLVFRKWGRRSYSLFTTLKKVVHISVLSVTYLLAVPVAAMAIARDTSEIRMQYDLDEVEVTASRVPVIYSQLARVLSVIEAQEIERMPAESVQDLLEYVAGVDIRQRGAEGVQADVSIRGGTFDQVLILLNGINITDPQTGHHNLNFPVSISQIERIEILKGPAARVYGPNAFSGAINIVTRKPISESVTAQFSTGSFGYINSDLSGTFRTGNMSHLMTANRKKSNGYTENTDFKSSSAFYLGEWDSGAGNLLVQGGIAGKGFGANSFYTPVYPNQFEEVQTLFGSIRLESNTRINLTPAIYWRRLSDKFMLFRDNAPEWYSNHNFHRTDVWGVDINSWFIWAGGKTSLGTGFRSEAILSNVLGEPMKERIDRPGREEFFTHSKQRMIASVFAEHVLIHNKWSISAGLMTNFISDNSAGMNFFPGVDLSYEVLTPLKVVASWNTSLRMPTFTDLYYSGPTNRGNPDLKPERSSAMEGGIKLNSKRLKGYLVVYHRSGTNLIDWIKTDSDVLWSSMNHTQITSRGIDMHLMYSPVTKLRGILPSKIEAGYLYNMQDKAESPYMSYYVMDNLRHKFVASINQQLSKRLSLDLRMLFQDREGTFSFYDGNAYTGERAYSPFWLFDAKASYQFSFLNLYISANNLFDRRYYDLGNIMQPGRWLKAGVSFHLR